METQEQSFLEMTGWASHGEDTTGSFSMEIIYIESSIVMHREFANDRPIIGI